MNIAATTNGKAPKFTASHRKEKAGLYKEYSALVSSPFSETEMRAVITLRLYATGSRFYACLWINSDTMHINASGFAGGFAGGYGYCKASGAASDAIRNSGIDLSEDIHGRGTSAIRDAILALAVLAGCPDARLHESHA